MNSNKRITQQNLLTHIFAINNPIIPDSALTQSKKYILSVRQENLKREQYFTVGTPPLVREKTLIIFLSQTDAQSFIRRNELLEYSVCESSKSDIDKEVRVLNCKKAIRSIMVYTTPPIGTTYSPEEFLGISQLELLSTMPLTKEIQWNGLMEMKRALDTFKKDDRRKHDSRLSCENVHTLIDFLMRENFIEPSQIGDKVGLSADTIRAFCRDPRDNSYSKATVVKLLKYFGLEKYTLSFRNQCDELRNEILAGQSGHEIDRYYLKKGHPSSDELFKLESLNRVSFKDSDTDCEYYLYQGVLTSELRKEPIRIRITNPSPITTGSKVPCIVGKYYAIEGLDPLVPADSDKPRRITQSQIALLGEQKTIVINPDKPGFRSELSIEEQFERQEVVLAQLKKEFNCSYHEAIEKAKRLSTHEKILDQYYDYAKNGKFAAKETPNRNNFHIKKLVEVLRYSFYDACDLLISLYNDKERDEVLARLRAEESKVKK